MTSAVPDAVSCIADIEYVQRSTGPLLLDLFLPTNFVEPPLIVYMHGGAWVMGNRKEHAERLRSLAAQGFAVAGISYRTANLAPFPAQREDAADAIDFLRRDCSRWGVDVRAVGLYGASAGAHLAAMIGLTLSESIDCPVFAFAGLFGRYDLTEDGLDPRPDAGLRPPDEVLNSVWPAELGGKPVGPMKLRSLLTGIEEAQLDQDALQTISPQHRLDELDFPVLVLHGTADGVTHHGHGENFVQAAQSLGKDAELVLVNGANHEDPWFDGPEAAAKIGEFFRRHAPKSDPPHRAPRSRALSSTNAGHNLNDPSDNSRGV